MVIVTVNYPATAGGTFDFGYYMETHIPLVKRLWSGLGLHQLRVLRGVDAPDGAPPAFVAVALLTWESMGAFTAAVEQHGAEVFGDVPRFTSISPFLQFNEELG